MRTYREKQRELEYLNEFFDTAESPLIPSSKVDFTARPKRDYRVIETPHNSLGGTYYQYLDRARFRSPKKEVHKVMLKGDMFLHYRPDKAMLNVINVKEDVIVLKKETTHISLIRESERLTEYFEELLLLY